MSDFLITLAEITLTMSAVILLLLLLGPLLSRRYAIRWRYWAWLAVAARLLIPVNLSLPEAPVRLEAPRFLPALTRELGLAQPVRLLTCPGVKGPMMTGLLAPTVILPEEALPREDLWFILRHELTHFKRRDILYKTLLLCANLVHWFNPLTWVLLRSAEGDLERCCDDDVVKGLPDADRARYGQVILDAVRSGR